MSKQPDVIVVGAGIIGMLSARELAASGLSVMLVERGKAGREASRAAAGILSPMYPWEAPAPINALARWSQAHYPVLTDELRRGSGINPQWTVSGLLCPDAASTAARAWAETGGHTLDQLDEKQTRQLEPALANNIQTSLFVPDVAHVHVPRLMRALRETVLNEGIPLREDAEVTALLRRGKRIEGVRTATEELHAGYVVVACGAWSGQLAAESGTHIPVEPVSGQLIEFDGPPGLVRRILYDGKHYLFARRSGQIVVGSTREKAGFDRALTQTALAELTTVAERLLPVLKGVKPKRHWSGLRPGSADGRPYIGASPVRDGLYFNTGHDGEGITLAPASARLLADILSGRAPAVDPAPYALAGRMLSMDSD
ncbi:MAG: glycine oxidase ThiO [Gammaproteobacteria bacterium]